MNPSLANAVLARGNQALERGDWEAALDCFQSFLCEQETAEAHEGLSWAAWWLNDGAATLRAREAAYRLYRQASDDVSAARMAIWLARDHYDLNGERAIANGWCERARHLLEGQPVAPEHGLVPILECWEPIYNAEDPEVLKRAAAEAIAASRHSGDTDTAIVARALEGLALVSESRVAEGMKRLDEAAAAARGGELHEGIWNLAILCFLIDACERVGDLGRAAEWCAQMREHADRVRLVNAQGICRARLGALLVLRGEWEEAETTLTQAQAYFEDSRPLLEPEAMVRLAELRRRQGRDEEALDLFRQMEWHPLAVLGLARMARDAGRLQDAEHLTERYLRLIPQGNRLKRTAGLELAVRLCTALGKAARADEALLELQAIADSVDSLTLHGATCFSRAAIAVASGDQEGARAYLEDAVARFEESGLPYEAGLARTELAQTLTSLGHLERALEEAETARTRLETIGAAPAAQKAGAISVDLDRRLSGGSAEPSRDVLSPRQLEILRHIAEGKTNKVIAADLFLSEKTVDRHVTNIFNKLGVSSRAAATAHAYQNKLI